MEDNKPLIEQKPLGNAGLEKKKNGLAPSTKKILVVGLLLLAGGAL